MVARILGVVLLVGSAVGCATSSELTPTRSARMTPRSSAARMYYAAEHQAELGRYDDAIRLVRHAILALEPSARNDELRHLLVLRLADLQMHAAYLYREPAFAQDAANMLLAYGFRHEELFGDDKQDERDLVFEMLYDAETLAETLAEPQSPEPAPDELAQGAKAQYEQPVDDHAGEVLEDEMTRKVRVHKGWFYDPDDPVVRQRMESPLSNALGYNYLTSPEPARFAPRALVRQVGMAKSTYGEPSIARRLGRQAVRAAKPQLRECYARAAARGGVLETRAVLEFTVDAQGQIGRTAVVSGDVVDGLGDACVIEKLDAVALEDQPQARQRVRVTMLFFYDGGGPHPANQGSGGMIDPASIGRKAVFDPSLNDFSVPDLEEQFMMRPYMRSLKSR